MKFEEAAKRWGAAKLREKNIDVDEVTQVYFESWDKGGCETCGSDIRHEATVYYTIGGGKTNHRQTFEYHGLEDVLKDLFKLSEER